MGPAPPSTSPPQRAGGRTVPASALPAHEVPANYAWLSIAAALVTLGIKLVAAVVTGSVGLLADALESFVNLAAGVLALLVLRVAARPPDEEHHYGHEKAEYFSSGAEGTLILLAAASITVSAVRRLLDPQPVAQLDLGLLLLVVAALVNLAVGLVLRSAGRRLRSITLRANGQHLLTDVWTSAGVVVALGAVALTGWQAFDPLIGLVVAAQIAWTGLRLLGLAISGLMDRALTPGEVEQVTTVLERHADEEHGRVRFHALRTRRAGARSFVSFHVQVPGAWTVQRGHDLLETMEEEIRNLLPAASVFTHLEPLEDPVSYHDTELDRV